MVGNIQSSSLYNEDGCIKGFSCRTTLIKSLFVICGLFNRFVKTVISFDFSSIAEARLARRKGLTTRHKGSIYKIVNKLD